MPRKPDPAARGRIVDAASRLFDAHGVHAVGMQQIVDEIGCGKNFVYREFATKDELVVAYLGRSAECWQVNLKTARIKTDDPAEQMRVLVEHVVAAATDPRYRGCAIYNTFAEFPDADHPVNQAAVANFEQIRENLYDLAEQAGAADPKQLADRLMLIIDGLKVNGAAMGKDGAAPAAVAFATDVIRQALAGQS